MSMLCGARLCQSLVELDYVKVSWSSTMSKLDEAQLCQSLMKLNYVMTKLFGHGGQAALFCSLLPCTKSLSVGGGKQEAGVI
jgi:hypothetical protein